MFSKSLAFAVCAMKSSSEFKAVKICGVVDPSDVAMIGEIYAKVNPSPASLYIGMVLQPNSIRSIDTVTARKISDAARSIGATPVAVFVNETVGEIDSICDKCDVNVAQLHGPGSKKSFIENGGKFDSGRDWINVQDVLDGGEIVDPRNDILRHGDKKTGECLWTLYDAIPKFRGGSGKPFDWAAFEPVERPWVLAGGLGPKNVRKAVEDCRPNGLDVIGGLCGPDQKRKDMEKVERFLEEAASAYGVVSIL